jgi:hypothetical protein
MAKFMDLLSSMLRARSEIVKAKKSITPKKASSLFKTITIVI